MKSNKAPHLFSGETSNFHDTNRFHFSQNKGCTVLTFFLLTPISKSHLRGSSGDTEYQSDTFYCLFPRILNPYNLTVWSSLR